MASISFASHHGPTEQDLVSENAYDQILPVSAYFDADQRHLKGRHHLYGALTVNIQSDLGSWTGFLSEWKPRRLLSNNLS